MSIPPLACLALTVVLWGSTYRATTIGTEAASGVVFSAVRVLPVAVVFLLLFGTGLRRLRPATVVSVGLTGWLMVAGFLVALSEGVDRAGAANASVLLNTAPLFVAGLAPFLLAEAVSPRRLLGVAAGFCGVALIFWSELGLEHGGRGVGLAIALGGGIVWAAGTLLVKALTRRDRNLDARSIVTAQYVAGAPLVLFAAAVVPGRSTEWDDGRLWLMAGFVAVAAAAGTWSFFAALEALPATRVATAQFAVPAVAVAIEFVAGSPPEFVQALGIVLVVASIASVVLVQDRPPELPPAAEARA
jgi:drug/metabolite transporter (DMT)-like permease